MASYNSHVYAHTGLATAGLAVMSHRIAYELRPDLWASQQDCGIDFSRKFEATNVHRMLVTIEGYGTVLVLTRSLDRLAERIEWIVGRPVLDLGIAAPETPPAPKPDLLRREQINAERIANMRKMAAEPLPSVGGAIPNCCLRLSSV